MFEYYERLLELASSKKNKNILLQNAFIEDELLIRNVYKHHGKQAYISEKVPGNIQFVKWYHFMYFDK